MAVLSHPDYDDHEAVVFHRDPESGLAAIVAIHSTALGCGLGGCRVYPYATEAEAIADVLRLSRGMTYKAALAGLKQGGGKSVVLADPRRDKTPAMMRAMGRLVQSLGGRYVIAEDSGSDEADMREVARETAYVGGGAAPLNPDDPGDRDTSAATALGVFYGIQAAARHRLQRTDLQGLRVAIQGVGKVGAVLAQHLHEAGAQLFVSDVHPPLVEACVQRFDATAVDGARLFDLEVDVLSPCAMGAVLNDVTVPRLQAAIVAGAANNQLEEPRHGHMLMQRGVLYAPDYAINAGGIINLYYTGATRRWQEVDAHLHRIAETLSAIFERAAEQGEPTHLIADRMAESVFRGRTT
ncbi:Glu/Leu/Phe/Val family dehydrogenase [Panacagrimonas sp.]|uniref:Glu/Leu/Phe/Val family dehydrogenase n=1 Tax=Panacagrimonas sp. TaxID=2480088 RepID=UPI003B529489